MIDVAAVTANTFRRFETRDTRYETRKIETLQI